MKSSFWDIFGCVGAGVCWGNGELSRGK